MLANIKYFYNEDTYSCIFWLNQIPYVGYSIAIKCHFMRVLSLDISVDESERSLFSAWKKMHILLLPDLQCTK